MWIENSNDEAQDGNLRKEGSKVVSDQSKVLKLYEEVSI